MPGTVNIYYIWYGPWNTTTDTTQTLLTNFAKHVGGTPYFNINKSYYDATNATVSGAVNFGGATYDLGSQGTVLRSWPGLAQPPRLCFAPNLKARGRRAKPGDPGT